MAGRGFVSGDPPAFCVRARAPGDHFRRQPEVESHFDTEANPKSSVNERIRVPQIRVIGDDGTQVGVVPVREALDAGAAKGLDLVEFRRPPGRPYAGSWTTESSSTSRAAGAQGEEEAARDAAQGNQDAPKIEEHDYSFKMQHAREFLERRDKVKLTVTFRGREIAHQDIGHRLIQKIIADLADGRGRSNPARSEGARSPW
jgi:translation initiation factor IF-3